MKLPKVITFLIVLSQILSKKLTTKDDTTNDNNKKSIEINNYFNYLFDIPRQIHLSSKSIKSKTNKKNSKLKDQISKSNEFIRLNSIPIPKPNYYDDIKQGENESAYFFDFLDPLLQFEISYEFKHIFEQAKNFPYDPLYDPYSYDKLYNPTISHTNSNLPLKLTDKKKSIWEKSITIPQVNRLINEWEWFTGNNSAEFARLFVDKYDFDGDGRLNCREFLLGMVVENIDNVGGKYSCKNCMEFVVELRLDIIYKFLNIDNASYITSKNIWDGLKHLKRGSNSNFYSLYTCPVPDNLRTDAVNDFVLKINADSVGTVNETEFKLGILLGYWNRQTDEGQIYLANEKNRKNQRWTPEGVDIVCEKIKSIIVDHKSFNN